MSYGGGLPVGTVPGTAEQSPGCDVVSCSRQWRGTLPPRRERNRATPLQKCFLPWVLHPTLLSIEQQIRSLGYAATLHLGGILGQDTGQSDRLVAGAWHDDVAFCVQAPLQVLSLLQLPRSLALSFRPSRLRDSSLGWRAWGPAAIGITTEYKHLVSMVCADGSLKPDIRRRIGEAASVASELRRRVFAHPGVTLRARCHLFRSLLLSRETHNVGAWSALSQTGGLLWQGGLLRLYKALLTGVRQDDHISQVDLCCIVLPGSHASPSPRARHRAASPSWSAGTCGMCPDAPCLGGWSAFFLTSYHSGGV